MAKAKRLPSGTYRCVVYIGTDENGKKKYKSITDPDKRRCEKLAAEYADEHRKHAYDGTFEAAMDHYFDIKEAVLSPSTMRGYKVSGRYLKRRHSDFCKLKLGSIDKDALQQAVNEMASKYKPKTVRNHYGLISAVMEYHDYPTPNISLPEKERPNLKIPDTEDVQKIIEASKGTDLEIPVLLAAFAPMRRSEIVALKLDDIDGNVIHVCRAFVVTDDYKVIEKGTKTYESDRYIPMPNDIIKKIREKGYVTEVKNPNVLTGRFERLVRKIGCEGVRFHDLRHWCASYLHAQGVPDIYIMARGGWKTDNVMKAVYRHALASEENRWAKNINKAFDNVLSIKSSDGAVDNVLSIKSQKSLHERQHEA